MMALYRVALTITLHFTVTQNVILITCARCHVRTTALETKALVLSAREFGTVCHVACEHLTSATNILNILKHYRRHKCFDKATALCVILYKSLRNTLIY